AHNIDTVIHVYQRPGSYQVKIRATNNCTDTTDIENVRVFASPNANFVATPISVCVGDSILFTNQTDTATGYLWHFNNGNISTLTNPWQQFTKAGTYNVSLIATRQYGPGNACNDTIQKAINVTASLPGLFLVTDSVSSCVPFTVTFRNQNLPSSLTIWDFGDGVKDTGNIVTHTYSKLGVYKATMMAINASGCNFLHEKQITVNGPAAIWRYDKGFVCGNNPVRFEVTAQNTDSILYDFGDGKKLITNQRVVFHQYANNGNYIPSITLFNGKNCVLPLVGTDTIKVDYVQAGFKWVSNAACNITQLAFTDTSRAFNGLKRWEWSLGDNTTQTVPNLTHSYTATGTYNIRLIAFGNSGCSDTTETSINIKVNKSPLALIFADTVGCVGQPVNYKANIVSDDSLVIANWQFSNGLTINGTAVNNLYSTTGSYTVRFVTGTAFGCFDTANASITIHPTPRTVVNPDLLICSGQQVQLTATGANNYVWQPLNGSLNCTNCATPIAAPLTTTQYIATGTNLFGC
ncbi:MAG: PKD domain-containing protein, partial [Chitinophagaceae bacterium]